MRDFIIIKLSVRSATLSVVAGLVFAVIFGCGPVMESVAAPAKMISARSMPTMGGIVSTPEWKASPIFTGKKLPVPPRQHSGWPPPKTDLPTNYISATAILFQEGMADPRGCDYRVIEVEIGNVWKGDGGVVKTHGWVLPGKGTPRFAVCWNGMVYPVVSVGVDADLEADVENLITNGFTTWYSAVPERMSVSQDSLLGIKGCFLLRLGRVDLARRYWLAELRRGRKFRYARLPSSLRTNSSGANVMKLPNADPYLTWATEWAWGMFDRMICAHERGDERLALLTAQQLAKAQPEIEAECAKRGFQRQSYYDYQHRGQKRPFLEFLGQFPQILADLERRAREPKPINIIEAGITNYPNQSKRIALLIDDLDLVEARQWSQPGWVNLADDPIVAALIHEGDAAVEPLLDCVEHDQRLTRSVGFGRDFHRDRTVISVRRAAWVALETILHARFSSVAEMRAYWNKYKDLKLEDRWYAILQDDNARSRWREAAANIVQPANVRRYPGGYSETSPAPSNAPVPLLGESLRAKTHPTVTELLTRRALEVPTNNPGSYDLGACCQMAEYLARWDVHAALPVAHTLCKRIRTVMEYTQKPLGKYLVQLSLARARAGGQAPFDDYAKWIITTTPAQFSESDLRCLEPLRQYPTDPMIQRVAETLFGSTNSAWGNLPWKSDFGRPVLDLKLVALPAYRTLLGRELQKTNVCGTVTLQRPGYLEYTLNRLHKSGGFRFTLPQDSSTATGARNKIRWCDWIAFLLSRDKQIPFFNPFAPITERDAAVEEAQKLLEQR